MLALLGLLRRAQRIAGDTTAHVLEPDLSRHQVLASELGAPRDRELLEHLVLHEGQDVGEMLVLVVVGVDVDDQEIVEIAPGGLLACIGKEPRGVQLLDRYASAAISDEVHGASPESNEVLARVPKRVSFSGPSSSATCRVRRPQGWRSAAIHSPSA